jgi:hypothetical protein
MGGYLVVRVGGGFMKFEEWVNRFGRREGVVVGDPNTNNGGMQTNDLLCFT